MNEEKPEVIIPEWIKVLQELVIKSKKKRKNDLEG
jgi:hypothetical protein